MDDNESYTTEDLEKCSYRYLQQVAKTMKLPSNVKKMHLIEMIHTYKYGTESELQNLIENVRRARHQVSQKRRIDKNRKARLQGGEITSTSRTVSPERKHIVIRYPESRRSIVSTAVNTDRVLRSTGREPGRFRYLNMNNAVIGVIKPQNKLTNTQHITRAKTQNQVKRCIDGRPKFVINKFKSNIVNCNNSVLKYNEGIRQPITSTPHPAKRGRKVSGIYPLIQNEEPQLTYKTTTAVNFRNGNGTVPKNSAFPQTPNFNHSFEDFIENKRQSHVTVQDIINSNIDEHIFSNTNMTEFLITGTENPNKDYPNMSMVTETSTFIDQPTLIVNNADLHEGHNENESILKISNLLKERQTIRLEKCKQKSVTYSANDELKRLLLMNRSYQNDVTLIMSPTKIPVKNRNYLSYAVPNPITNTTKAATVPKSTINIPNAVNISQSTTGQHFTNICQNNDNAFQSGIIISNGAQTNYDSYQSVNPEPDYIETKDLDLDNDGNFSVYYHKKIRAEQVRSKIYQREHSREENNLPKINQAFRRFNANVTTDYTQPLYVQVSSEADRILSYPIFIAQQNNTTILESLYNFKKSFITNQPLLQIATTTNTKCVYSTPIICTPIAKPFMGEQPQYTLQTEVNSRYSEDCKRDIPEMSDYVKLSEEEVTLSQELVQDSSDDSSIQSQGPNVSIPEMVEDALELISQDGDYMERINMDLRVQCFLCEWGGPRIILESHVRKDHAIQTVFFNEAWRVVFTLTSLRDVWSSRVLEKNQILYVLSSKWEENCLYATLATISSYISSTKTGSITFFNRFTSENITWQGEIQQLHPNMPFENHSDGLKLNFGSNTEEFNNNSSLNEMFFTFFVTISD